MNQVILSRDPDMHRVLQIAENIAPTKATILIQGESGTGKELLARYIHNKSSRSNKGFIAINCAAVPENLLESELFGYDKGAFTGAAGAKPGKFELANGGTFLLDEISELPLLLQAKILRVIQEGEIERLGGTQVKNVDVRILCTSNRDLLKMVKEGQFREDLYYRLNVIPLRTLPLRDRPNDVNYLTQHFVDHYCTVNNIEKKVISAEAMARLNEWNWPGNVRELQNTIQRAVLMSKSNVIEVNDIEIPGFCEQKNRNRFAPGMSISQAEKLLILKTLDHTNQNRTQAARMLGISIRTLRNKIREYKTEGLL